MDTDALIAALKKALPSGDAAALERLEAALRLPGSFEALAQECPPELRYLGPGAWLEAIKKADNR
ncbi:MAG: hypothetical protein LBD37_04235 [Treponema sp.]|jgi:hypothetical protein|nr:hypothetical protein [Treponema sp.]